MVSVFRNVPDARIAGHVLVECLQAHGVELIFGVPGESYLAVLDGLHGSDIRFVNTRHESGASFMAASYGKLTGKPGVATVTRGPGATNASIGVHTAMQDSSPLVLFVGQIDSRHRGREAFQEIDYRAFFGSVAKWVGEVDYADRMPELVHRAFAIATSGRPGPVVLSLPEDVLRTSTAAVVPRPSAPAVTAPPSNVVADTLALLDASERPLILAGGGGWTAAGRMALRTFAEARNLPVAVAFRSQDLLANDSPSFIGDAGLGKAPRVVEALEQADLVLALGVRFGEILTDGYARLTNDWFVSQNAKLVHAHSSIAELGKIVTPDVALPGDINTTVSVLASAPAFAPPPRPHTLAAHKAWEASVDASDTGMALDMSAVMRHLRRELPSDSILTNGAGNFSIWSNKHFAYGAEACLLAPQSGSMGYGIPAAVMAKLVHPERTIVCFAGDGDFQMTASELATGVAEGAAPIVLVVNNGTYGTIRMHQERDFPDRVSGTALANPDFAAIGRAMGMHGERVERTRRLCSRLWPVARFRDRSSTGSHRAGPHLADTAGAGVSRRVVIVGAGQGALSFAAKARTLDGDVAITMLGDESVPPYQRPPLSKAYLSGTLPLGRLMLRDADWYELNRIEWHGETRVVAIDRHASLVETEDGQQFAYDNLVLATGSNARRLPDAIGGYLPNVLSMRTIADADALGKLVQPGRRMVVIGGGYIGLEAAAVARQQGVEVVLLEAAQRILGRVASSETADYYRALHRAHGVDVRERAILRELRSTAAGTVDVVMEDGETLTAEMVVVGIGITPNAALAEAADIRTADGDSRRRVRTHERSADHGNRRLRSVPTPRGDRAAGERPPMRYSRPRLRRKVCLANLQRTKRNLGSGRTSTT